ncbi:ATP-binding protein [Geobacter benzoatilyticus]|uniref:ATP-binding protein n=1 Tax=Geobacter benzoatilyticus TaxID=2815309 RepID=A0ABX7Q6C2_9BACT|nr:ATP-binding protein [Geobacter benzoatilyticus]QSV46613.1 ATP-binding protein [Geobacter benzoatilyticus]
MISRSETTAAINTALGRSRVVALLGPRQCGKTTLARQFVPSDSPNYIDLEDPLSLARLDEPMTALRDLTGLVVIDEVQRRPELFPVLRVLADRDPLPARFLILGSASPALLRQSSESLAGRVETVTIGGLALRDVGTETMDSHWLRGGFPLSFLAGSDADSFGWRKNFIQTFLERDLPQLGIGTPAATLLRFWTMLAHYHGQVWNAAEPARSLGVNESTTRRYLDLLEGVFMVRQLQPWYENLKKRQVKSPKIYFRDSGLLHQLLGIRTPAELLTHPKCGASWEGYVIEELLAQAKHDEAYFWGTHSGAELDLLLISHGSRIGVEIKRMDAPRLTPSMRIAMEDLKLERLTVVYPGTKRYPLAEGVEVMPFREMCAGSHSIVLGESR